MIREFLFVLAFLMPAFSTLGAEMEIELQSDKTVYVQGEPIILMVGIRNTSDHSVSLKPGTVSDIPGYFNISRTDGLTRKGCYWDFDATDAVTSSSQSYRVEPNWKKSRIEIVNCGDLPGEYSVAYLIPSFQNEDGKNRTISSFASNEIRFWINEPKGIDREALEKFGPTPVHYSSAKRLIEEFPTSAYAIHAFATLYGIKPLIELPDEDSLRRNILAIKNKKKESLSQPKQVATDLDGRLMVDSSGNEQVISYDEWFRTAIALGERILSTAPETLVSDWVGYAVANYYVELLNFTKATVLLNELQKRTKDPQLRSMLTIELDVLND